MMRRAAILIFLMGLSACTSTPTEWVRTDTSPAQRQRDIADCQQIGASQAFDESMSSRPLYPPWTGTGFNRGIGMPWERGHTSPSYFDRGPRTAEIADYCMRGRGYQLQASSRPRS